MKKRKLGRSGLEVSPIALGGAPFGYCNSANDWDPHTPAGRRVAIGTINHAIDRGINYLDTAPAYGDGYSETLFGEVMKTRRDECVLASKVWYDLDKEGTIDSVHQSLKRLQTDHIDVIQVHTRWCTAAESDHILNGGLLEGLLALREAGKIRFIGITAEEPWTLMPFLACPEFDVYQIAYNCIYQNAALHFLPESVKAGVGVSVMRAMTSGILPVMASYLAPECKPERLLELSLQFVLSDSRIHSAIAGMRWTREVDQNVKIAETWKPPTDFALLPRTTREVYEIEDQGPVVHAD
jgi:aryl-alcohol dehydrogenase-like predicted oxidoreductase